MAGRKPLFTAAMSNLTFTLPEDLREYLEMLAMDTGTSVAALLRWGAMLVLEETGGPLPDSVAHLRRAPFGGQVAECAHEVQPECIRVPVDDDVFAAIDERVGKGRFVRLVRDVVTEEMRRAEGVPTSTPPTSAPPN